MENRTEKSGATPVAGPLFSQDSQGTKKTEGPSLPTGEAPKAPKNEPQAEKSPQEPAKSPEVLENSSEMQPFAALEDIPEVNLEVLKSKAAMVFALDAHVYSLVPKVTTEKDWVRFGTPDDPNEEFYLQSKAVYRVAKDICGIFGIKLNVMEPMIRVENRTTQAGAAVKEVIVTGYVEKRWERTGEVETFGPIIGKASSDDPFFRDKSGVIMFASDVSIAKMEQKATTGYKRNAIVQPLGISGYQRKHLKDAGLNPDRVISAQREGSSATMTDEEKVIIKVFETDLHNAFDQDKAKARAWMKAETEWKKNGVVQREGFEDVNRLRPNTPLFKIMQDKLERLKKDKTQGVVATAPTVKAFKEKLAACKNLDGVLQVKSLVKAATMTDAEREALKLEIEARENDFAK